jgi:hypothetical protein
MKVENEPAFKRTADAASGAAQRSFLQLSEAQLSLLAATAVVSGWTPVSDNWQRAAAILICLLMTAALAVNLWLRQGRYDDTWFRCRALAENIKSAMWYFIMSSSNQQPENEREYLRQIEEVQERLPGLDKELSLHRVEGPMVTHWMRHAQALPTEEKLDLFRAERVQDQIEWYQSKAAFNAWREKQWQAAIFILEFIALVYAGLYAWKLWQFNAVGGIASTSAAFLAWTQTKRHSDLANGYAVAAEDLRRIAAKREHAASDSEIQKFVREVETAVSREHSMWLARRGV